jgi:GWxTD domain-containing protein
VTALKLFTIAGLAALTPAWLPPPEGQESLAVNAVRFYRPDARQTQVKVFIQIPYTMLEAGSTAPPSGLTYHVAVKVRDSTGLELVHNAWDGHAPSAARQQGVSALEILDFALAPGRYRLDIEVTDSTSGRKLGSNVTLEGFANEPALSDLLLAPEIREAGPGDTLPGSGEIRKGKLLITASAELLLTPLRSKAFYLLETYNADADSAQLALTVKDSAGKVVISTPSSTARLPKGGGMLTGALDLTGLPPGRYQLTTGLAMDGRKLERSARFEMADLAETMAKAADAKAVERTTDVGYFADMTEKELDDAEGPLALIAKSGELSVYNDKLSLPAKRRFLSEFWSGRDPSPGTQQNELRDKFYSAIAYADKAYREGGRAARPGWKTDRGRVYTRNGVPDDVLRRTQQGNAPPYEVWRYTKGKGRFYVFADRTGFGAYNLLHSNDLQEPGLTNWQQILGLDVVQDIGRFLGVDLIKIEPGAQF